LHFGLGGYTMCDIKLVFTNGTVKRFPRVQADRQLAPISPSTTTVPVELAQFDAQAAKGKVVLSWQTASETNNFGFAVERSGQFDGPWHEIGFVDGAGTTSQLKNYTFVDQDIYGAMTFFYRLRQVDFDGPIQYSQVTTVNLIMPGAIAIAQNFPNPFNASTIISFEIPPAENSKVDIAIYDILGRKIRTLTNGPVPSGYHDIKWDGKNDQDLLCGSGIYFCTLVCGQERLTKKMIKLD
jgi:hypothetical protein